MAAPVTTPQTSTGTSNSPAASQFNLQNGVLPGWLVPVAGLAVLLVLANTSLFRPVTIILVGIIALWLMNG